jgi:dephospho-CoA kinase
MIPKVIGLVGPIRAGKTTVSQYLCSKYGYKNASNSKLLTEMLSHLGQAPTRENLGNLGDAIFKTIGNDAFARYRLSKLSLDCIVVDGIRYADELEQYRTESTFRLLGVDSSSEERYRRSLGEDGYIKDQNISGEKFDAFSKARSELDVPSLLLKADRVIFNSGSVLELYEQIDQALSDWGVLP